MTVIAYALLLPLLGGPAAPSVAVAPPRSLGPVGLAGILVSAAGAGLASVGVVRLAQGETRRVSPEDREIIVTTDPHLQGRAFLGAGLAVAAVGVTALVIDLKVLRGRRARRMALVPLLGPMTAGLSFRRTFEVRPWR